MQLLIYTVNTIQKGVKRTTTEKIKYKRNKRQNTKVNCIEIDPKKERTKIYKLCCELKQKFSRKTSSYLFILYLKAHEISRRKNQKITF